MLKLIYQDKMLDFIKKFPKDGTIMIPVYGKTSEFDTDAFFQCMLIPLNEVNKEMKTEDINNWTSLAPGFSLYGDATEAIYRRYNNDINMEPFVIARDFYNLIKKPEIEIVEEFRLLNNLYFNREKNEYVDLANNVVVIKIENELVKVDRKYLKDILPLKKWLWL